MTPADVRRLGPIADSLLPGKHSVESKPWGLVVRGPFASHPETARELGKEARRIASGAKLKKVRTYTVERTYPTQEIIEAHTSIERARDIYNETGGNSIIFDDITGKMASRKAIEG